MTDMRIPCKIGTILTDMRIPCKIGTIPMVIYARDCRAQLKVGNIIKIKERRGAPWTTVKVNYVGHDGYFQADRF
jgi:hypothetical protein